MATRDELLGAVSVRYQASSRAEKSQIVDEFAAATGYHRKHAMRVLRAGSTSKRSVPRPSRRIYGDAEREALILWEASDRVCGKRLKAIVPALIDAMVRHGHLALAPEVRAALLKMSAATIDRALQPQCERCSLRRRRPGSVSLIRRSIPVRTFSDWGDPPPCISKRKRLGRQNADLKKVEQARRELANGAGVLKTAKLVGLGTGTVQRLKREMPA